MFLVYFLSYQHDAGDGVLEIPFFTPWDNFCFFFNLSTAATFFLLRSMFDSFSGGGAADDELDRGDGNLFADE
jgi:hypothetical protein